MKDHHDLTFPKMTVSPTGLGGELLKLEINEGVLYLDSTDAKKLGNPLPRPTALRRKPNGLEVFRCDDGRVIVLYGHTCFSLSQSEWQKLVTDIANLAAPMVEENGFESSLPTTTNPVNIRVVDRTEHSRVFGACELDAIEVNGVYVPIYGSAKTVAGAVLYVVESGPDESGWCDSLGLYERVGNLIHCNVGNYSWWLDDAEALKLIGELQAFERAMATE